MELQDNKQEKTKKKHYGRGCPRPVEDKELAIKLVGEGGSFRSIGRIVGCTHNTVIKWVKEHTETLEIPTVSDLSQGVEVDELCTFVKKK